jgi:hypothetical protein
MRQLRVDLLCEYLWPGREQRLPASRPALASILARIGGYARMPD